MENPKAIEALSKTMPEMVDIPLDDSIKNMKFSACTMQMKQMLGNEDYEKIMEILKAID